MTAYTVIHIHDLYHETDADIQYLKLKTLHKVYKIYDNVHHLCNIKTFTYCTLTMTCFGHSMPSSDVTTKPFTFLLHVTGLIVTPDDGLLWLKHVMVRQQCSLCKLMQQDAQI
jgi:hypothetical protein